MIFVTVGTTEFNGLVKAADELKLTEELIIQRGGGSYVPKNHESFEYTDKFQDYIEKADVVVTHGGAGTIFDLVAKGKRVVGVENTERDDLHQFDLLGKMEAEGHLIWCRDLAKLADCIKAAEEKEFKKYTPPVCEIEKEILKLA